MTRSRQVRPPSIVDTSAPASMATRVVQVRAGGTRSSERDECPVSAETTIPTTRQCLQAAGLLPRSASVRRAPHFAWFRAHPHDIPLDGARGDGHDQPARKADRPPGPSAIIGPEHTVPVSPTPCPSVSERVRSEASRTVADSACDTEAALNVNDDDLAVGGDQYRHDYDPMKIVARWMRNEPNGPHSRTTSLALSSRRPTNLECLKWLSPVHSRNSNWPTSRLQPLAFGHLRFRQPLAPTTAPRLRQIRKRALVDLETLNFLNSCARVTGVKPLRVLAT